MKRIVQITAIAMVIAFAASFGTQVASAHGDTEVGDYKIVIGFHNEPAYQGEPNGLDLFVTNKTTNDPIKGLEDTLKAELIYGSATVPLKIEPQWGEEGAYTAYVIPTKAGAYTWHIFGTINSTPVDVQMTSGPDAFGEVAAKNTVSFPVADPTMDEVQAQIGQARTFGMVGTALGALGLIVGAIALFNRRTAQPQSATKQQPA